MSRKILKCNCKRFGFYKSNWYVPTKFLGDLRSVVISFLVTASRVRNDRDPDAKFGDGTAATTFDEDLDNVDMVVEIKASDKVQILKHWRPIFPTLNPLTINCKTLIQSLKAIYRKSTIITHGPHWKLWLISVQFRVIS